MKIKNLVILSSILLNVILSFLLYNEATRVDPGPVDIGVAFKDAVRYEEYSLAKTLMAEARVEHISEEILKEVNEIMSASTSFRTYELLEFDNGEMVLLNLTPDNKYHIQDVMIIPDDQKRIFK
ncbi:hypothetical protein [Litchfieldia salsa]|uniref:Uncharacterized protein n=1 Tax=Litchfieldia salsa TaxID=930152 RepID=A0A1H0SW39_9BACI|nr:hypothetical protein [Litchfieldia salsa]SDP45953.1 hypothetical protein SAMN05216565_103151 [Litchfieldia salsa]